MKEKILFQSIRKKYITYNIGIYDEHCYTRNTLHHQQKKLFSFDIDRLNVTQKLFVMASLLAMKTTCKECLQVVFLLTMIHTFFPVTYHICFIYETNSGKL